MVIEVSLDVAWLINQNITDFIIAVVLAGLVATAYRMVLFKPEPPLQALTTAASLTGTMGKIKIIIRCKLYSWSVILSWAYMTLIKEAYEDFNNRANVRFLSLYFVVWV